MNNKDNKDYYQKMKRLGEGKVFEKGLVKHLKERANQSKSIDWSAKGDFSNPSKEKPLSSCSSVAVEPFSCNTKIAIVLTSQHARDQDKSAKSIAKRLRHKRR